MKIFVEDISGQEEYYMLGDSSLTPWRKPLFLPDFDSDFRLFPAAAVAISHVGKSIELRFAGRYFSTAAAAFTVRAENMYRRLLEGRQPCLRAVSFDYSAFIAPYSPLEQLQQVCTCGLRFANTTVGEECLLQFDLSDAACKTVADLSVTNTLKTGDVILFQDSRRSLLLHERDRIEVRTAAGDIIHSFSIK